MQEQKQQLREAMLAWTFIERTTTSAVLAGCTAYMKGRITTAACAALASFYRSQQATR